MKSRRVGVIVPTGSEFGFIRESLDFSGSEVIDGQWYHHFQIPVAGVTGVVRVLSDMGQAPATLAAERIFSRLDVSLVVLIGTAASLDSKVRLGDVVVADQIQEYLRKTGVAPGAAGGSLVFERAAESWRTNARLVDYVNNFGWQPDGVPAVAAWRQAAGARYPGGPRQPPGGDPGPSVHVGPVATGDLRVAARAFADWIKRANRKLVALEMEAAGVALAAYHNDSADLLVVRGISDNADELKSGLDAGQGAAGIQDAWRRYAVRNAIEYLVPLLSSGGFPWRSKPATGTSAASRSGSLLAGISLGVEAADIIHDIEHEEDEEHLHHREEDHHPHLHPHELHDPHLNQEHGPEGDHEPHGYESADPVDSTTVESVALSEFLLEAEFADPYDDLGGLGDPGHHGDHGGHGGDHGGHGLI